VKVFLDANLLIYLNTLGDNEDSDLERFYFELLKEDLYTNALILDETIYISMSKYRVPYDLTFEFLKSNVLPFSTVIPIEESDVSLMEKYLVGYRKLKPSDAIHLSTMEKLGVANIASEDVEFDGVKEVKRIWFSKSQISRRKN
jgi:predicted nucleic acid-binding protein